MGFALLAVVIISNALHKYSCYYKFTPICLMIGPKKGNVHQIYIELIWFI